LSYLTLVKAHSLTSIIRLMGSVMVCPKVILFSDIRCISLQYCLSNGGKLVEPTTQSDIHSMNRFISNQTCLKSCYYWMGITDIYSEGNFTFASSGCRATVFNWTSGKICLCIKKWMSFKKKVQSCTPLEAMLPDQTGLPG
jgi:hypothetical protein